MDWVGEMARMPEPGLHLGLIGELMGDLERIETRLEALGVLLSRLAVPGAAPVLFEREGDPRPGGGGAAEAAAPPVPS